MKGVMIAGKLHGPFDAVTQDDTGLACFVGERLDCRMPFSVIGGDYEVLENPEFPPPVPAPVTIPEEVPKWAAEVALIEASLETLPATYFATIPAGKERKTAEAMWAKRPTLARQSPMLLAAIAGGILTAAQADTLFIRADEISREA